MECQISCDVMLDLDWVLVKWVCEHVANRS